MSQRHCWFPVRYALPVTSQRFCVTNRASTGDDGDGRYFYLSATVTNLGAEFDSKTTIS
jgi:hypothetical protein